MQLWSHHIQLKSIVWALIKYTILISINGMRCINLNNTIGFLVFKMCWLIFLGNAIVIIYLSQTALSGMSVLGYFWYTHKFSRSTIRVRRGNLSEIFCRICTPYGTELVGDDMTADGWFVVLVMRVRCFNTPEWRRVKSKAFRL